MFNRNILICAAMAIFAVLLGACESSGPIQKTVVNRVMKAPVLEQAPYAKVLVIGAVPGRDTARNVEFGMMQELERHTVEAFSFVRDSDETEPTEAAVKALVEKTGADAVLVVSGSVGGANLTRTEERVDLNKETRGGGLFNYFRYEYKEIIQPSYSGLIVDVVLVSDLYNADDGERVYSIESSTANAKSTYDIVIAESEAIVNRMKQDGLIR
jgi:hypothetical protein